MRTLKRVLYPNQYICLTGPPGVGKTAATIAATMFLRALPDVHLAPASVTRASLTDALKDAERTLVRPGAAQPVVSFNSLFACAEELGTFIIAYEGEFMSTLNFLWDCRYYDERKRHMKKGESLIIERPQLNLLACTTPSWLMTNLPQQAWSEGFASRILLIYSNDVTVVDPWTEESLENEVLTEAMHSDFLEIHSMYGLISPDAEVRAAHRIWVTTGQDPVPTHPRLAHYLSRRPIHLLKLAMCFSATRASDYTIRMEDYTKAKELLFEAESLIPMVFRDMSGGGDSSILDEAYHEVDRLFRRFQKPVPEYKLVHFISKRAPSYSVKKILEILYESNMVRIVEAVGPGGKPTYAPVVPEHHNDTVSKDL